MAEVRLILIGSLSGEKESVIDEVLVPYRDGDAADATRAAAEAARWLQERADGLEEAMKS